MTATASTDCVEYTKKLIQDVLKPQLIEENTYSTWLTPNLVCASLLDPGGTDICGSKVALTLVRPIPNIRVPKNYLQVINTLNYGVKDGAYTIKNSSAELSLLIYHARIWIIPKMVLEKHFQSQVHTAIVNINDACKKLIAWL